MLKKIASRKGGKHSDLTLYLHLSSFPLLIAKIGIATGKNIEGGREGGPLFVTSLPSFSALLCRASAKTRLGAMPLPPIDLQAGFSQGFHVSRGNIFHIC